MKVSFFPLILLLLSATVPAAQKVEKARPAQSIAELQQHLQEILSETHTPGLAVAIVHSDGPEWIAGLGKADVATGRAVTAQTLFRIGSTSKAFASLSILKLANEGKLSLDDPVRNLVPEVWFENRWEADDPVRVVNLLEHTTGWDDIHLREFAFDAPPSMDLRQALEYGRDTRVSRWPPGTRMAYCNTGPAVAAYIVEKITGQPFEEYVQQNFFIPIGMKTATYFKPSPLSNAILYNDIGKSPYRYWNILYRPSGAVNASAEDMAAYVQFYLDRGKLNGRQVMPGADIDRMESPSSTWAAKAGLKNGYGLSNYWSVRDGFTYHGHDGAVLGGLTDVGYMPDYGVGYFYSINSSNSIAYNEIGRAIRAYITLKLARPAVPDPGSLPTDVHDFMGFYEPDSPRIEMIHFLDRLTGISEVYFQDGKMRIASLQGQRTFIPVSGRFFRYVPNEGSPEPVASAVLLIQSDEQFIQTGWMTLKRMPTWLALLEIALTGFVGVAIVSVFFYAPFWLIGGFFKKRRRPAERAMRLWPLIALLTLLSCAVEFALASREIFDRLGQFSPWSAAIFLTTVLFAIASLASGWTAMRGAGYGVRRLVWIHSVIVSAALLIAAAYLAYWGVIGLRTWT